MLEIPGEEAPTDPGLQARLRKEEEDRAKQAVQRRKRRVLGALASVGVMALAGAGVWFWKAQQEATTYTLDEYYVMPLEDITGADPATPTPPEGQPAPQGNGGGTRAAQPAHRPTGGGTAPATSVAGGSDGMKTASSGSTVVAEPGVPTVALAGVEGGGLSDTRIDVQRTSMDVVLTDPQEIREMVGRVVRVSRGQVEACYSQRLKQVEGLKGQWKVSFVIGKDGATRGAKAVGQNASDAELEACIVRSVGSWKFQKIVKDQPIELPFRFGASGW